MKKMCFDYCILKLYTTFLNIDSYNTNINLDNKHHGVAEKEKKVKWSICIATLTLVKL